MNKASQSQQNRFQRGLRDGSASEQQERQITYPMVFYPVLLRSFSQQQPLIYPRYLKPQYPQSIWDFPVNKDTVKIIGSIGLLILGFVAVVQGLSLSAIASGLASWGGVTWGLWQFTRWWERRRKQHQLRFQPNYDAQLKQWQRAMKVRDRYLKNAQKHQHKQVEQRQQKLKNLLNGKVQQPVKESLATKGVSETMFLEVLKTVFPQIEFGGEFPIPGSRLCYSIDIAFIEPNTGLSIDIEIDEPYEGKTKKPHHCLDDDKDRNRNRFFNDRNWIVVRFAEEQVVTNPHGCCRYLADVVVNLTQDESLVEKVKELPLLESIKAWTSSESKQMAVWRYRERYLQKTGVYRQDKNKQLTLKKD